MKEKKPKIKKIKTKTKFSTSNLLFIGLCFILTIGLWFGLLVLENVLSEKITYRQVVAAKTDIPQDTIITEENAQTYFTLKQINILDTTDGCLDTVDELVGQKAIVPLYAGETVSLKDFENIQFYMTAMENPVEVSIKINDIADANGGKIRTGDIINLTMMFTKKQLGIEDEEKSSLLTESTQKGSLFEIFEETAQKENEETNNEENLEQDINESEKADEIMEENMEETSEKTSGKTDISIANDDEYRYESWMKYVLENLYITRVLDSSGAEIESTDVKSSASILFFIIEKEDEANLNNALANCSSLRISRVLNKPEEAFVHIELKEEVLETEETVNNTEEEKHIAESLKIEEINTDIETNTDITINTNEEVTE